MSEPDTEIRILGEMQKLSLKPGDILVVTSDQTISEEAGERIREHIGKYIPGHKVLIFSDGLKIGVLEAS